MRFFLPRELIEFEYFGSNKTDNEYGKKAESFQREIDFAFFAVNFGYCKSDYEALTPTEKAFIYKAWEDKKVMDGSQMYKSVYTAYYNCNRPKNKKALKLWTRQGHKADKAAVGDAIQTAKAADANDGNLWIDKIYKANGLKLPERRKNG